MREGDSRGGQGLYVTPTAHTGAGQSRPLGGDSAKAPMVPRGSTEQGLMAEWSCTHPKHLPQVGVPESKGNIGDV